MHYFQRVEISNDFKRTGILYPLETIFLGINNKLYDSILYDNKVCNYAVYDNFYIYNMAFLNEGFPR